MIFAWSSLDRDQHVYQWTDVGLLSFLIYTAPAKTNQVSFSATPSNNNKAPRLACHKKRVLGSNSNNPGRWWWGYQAGKCIHNWFKMDSHFSLAEFGLDLQREPEFDQAMPPSQERSKQQFRTIQDGRRKLSHNLGLPEGKISVAASYLIKLTDSK